MLEAYSQERLEQAGPDELADDLEKGHIVYFTVCPVTLPEEAELGCLRQSLPAQLKTKNVSYHPESGRATGIEGGGELARRVKETLVTHSKRFNTFLIRLARCRLAERAPINILRAG